MKTKCSWPHCTAESEQRYTDGWASCDGEGIPFLPETAFLCPKHARMYEEIACDPSLVGPDKAAMSEN
jgi:hypothetical protein